MRWLICVVATQMLSLVLIQAQRNIYITHPTDPETTSIMTGVNRIDFSNGMAHLYSNNEERHVSVEDVSMMGCKEMDSLRQARIPASFRGDFDFDISFSDADLAIAAISEAIVADERDADFEDFVENTEWQSRISILFGNAGAKVDGSVEGVTIQINGNHVIVNSTADKVEYILKGEATDGSFKIYGTKKACLILDGLNLTNPFGPAINNQCKKRLFVVLKDGSSNSLGDGATYRKTPNEDQRGCLFSEGQICLSGGGSLLVEARHKNGVASDDYVHIIGGMLKVTTYADKGDAIKAKDSFTMGGGVMHLLTCGGASKGVSSNSTIKVSGGKIVAICLGDGLWNEGENDFSSSCCVKADSTISLTGGELHLMATGLGGKGLSAGQENQRGDDLVVDGARIYARTSGARMYKDDATTSPKGLKASHNVEVLSGEIYVRCGGGDGAEGIEAKHDLIIRGGTIRSYCYDDGANAVNSEIYGGDLFFCSTANDGYDCNGGLYINGGFIYSVGAPLAQAGIDNDGKTFAMRGGVVVGVGGYSSTPWDSKSRQASVLVFLKKTVNYIAITDDADNNVITVKTPSTYNPLGVLLSNEAIMVGKNYRVYSFDELTGGTERGGVINEPTYKNATLEYEFTPTTLLTTLGSKK